MTNEAAANICMSIAQYVREARSTGTMLPLAINEAVERLTAAPGTTLLDALAFAAIARRVFAQAIEEMPADDDSAVAQPQFLCTMALHFLQRAIETLEVQTGFSAEGFTGEADAVNDHEQ
jgi:hypothetical protein